MMCTRDEEDFQEIIDSIIGNRDGNATVVKSVHPRLGRKIHRKVITVRYTHHFNCGIKAHFEVEHAEEVEQWTSVVNGRKYAHRFVDDDVIIHESSVFLAQGELHIIASRFLAAIGGQRTHRLCRRLSGNLLDAHEMVQLPQNTVDELPTGYAHVEARESYLIQDFR
jgi:hypothetical protein